MKGNILLTSLFNRTVAASHPCLAIPVVPPREIHAKGGKPTVGVWHMA